jgi:peptidoglycan/LPS O-acetylase OafA/YrhL
VSNSGRIPALDGLRGLFLMFVFAAHAQFTAMFKEDITVFYAADTAYRLPGRFGVTVFFFISGYIITTLMRSEFEKSGAVSFRNFYIRRVYRLFPPLYIVLGVAALLTWVGLLTTEVTLSAVVAETFHFTNYYALVFDKDSFFQGTKLLWSLAVEEHFYLGFPLLFLFLARRLPYNQIAFWLGVMCLVVLSWRYYLYYGLNVTGTWAFIATDSRIDSILFGCILGVWHNPAKDEPLITSKFLAIAVMVIGFGAVVFSVVYKDPAFERTLMFTIQGLGMAPVIAGAIRYPHWLVFRWLNWRPLVFLGLISYTFYLCHAMALRIALRFTDNNWVGFALAFLAAFIFSSLMYRYVETPLAKKRRAAHGTTKVLSAEAASARSDHTAG